jgi:cytidine deaminase
MSTNPFAADLAIPARLAAVSAETKERIAERARKAIAGANHNPADNMGGVVSSAVATELVEEFGLASIRDLMCLLLDTAKDMARPGISNFFVGAVGLEAETGNLILGGNVEFPGTHLGFTLHGEGFVFTRAMSRGSNISVIAIGEAHPCAHCRQCLAEYAASDKLELIDPLGHTLRLNQLYPWPFDPDYLGESGAVPGRELWPALRFDGDAAFPVSDALLAAGRRSHSPYSKCPGAVLLHLRDGNLVSGLAVESVAFNPTIHPAQAAMVDLLAHGYSYADIVGASLGTVRGGDVDYAASTRELLGRLAPEAPVVVLGWTP